MICMIIFTGILAGGGTPHEGILGHGGHGGGHGGGPGHETVITVGPQGLLYNNNIWRCMTLKTLQNIENEFLRKGIMFATFETLSNY